MSQGLCPSCGVAVSLTTGASETRATQCRIYPFWNKLAVLLLIYTHFNAGDLFGANRYVNWASVTPAPPYTGWATAATSIQAAVNTATAGDVVWVTNGVFLTGVDINKPVIVQSVSGPSYTILNVRGGNCAHLVNGATLSGFMLIGNGNAGVSCDGFGAVVTNCIIMRCNGYNGGGMSGGTAIFCSLIDNTAYRGGGAYGSLLINCLLLGNACSNPIGYGGAQGAGGGGARSSTLIGCLLRENLCGAVYDGCYLKNCALFGNTNGAAVNCTLTQCTVVSNDVGVVGSSVNNSIVYWNGNNASSSAFSYSCTTPSAAGSGNISSDPNIVGTFHIQTNSPCRGAGNFSYTSDADIDNEPWLNPPSMGCDEILPAAVSQAPVIIVQPTNQTRLTNTLLTLSVQVAGAVPLTYTWRKNGTDIPWAYGYLPWFTIPNAQVYDSGSYQVLVSNPYGSQLSSPAAISIGLVTIGDALNSPGLVWLTGGTAGQYSWTVQGYSHDGVAALRSGMPSSGQESWVQTSVTGPGTLTFWWAGTPNLRYCALEFYINGVLRSSISSYSAWNKMSYSITNGTQTFYWRFINTPGGRGDYGYLDEVTFTPAGAPMLKLAVPKVAGKDLVLGFDSSLNTSYVLESVPTVAPSTQWAPLKTNTGTGEKVTLSLTNVLSTNATGFYRLRIQ